MNWQMLFQYAVPATFGGAGLALVQSIMSRKQVKVDVSDMIQGTAAKQLDAMQRRLEQTEARLAGFEHLFYKHQIWDADVFRKLIELGVPNVTPPPQLWPGPDA
ncbi:hypothetical protein [Nocardia brasiliensis]|uniref:hypothetical protein n=1 Tax=Nocardia brasiliensis TaxID=37326 RepID=UPI0024544846|nr:hypothetical protein [Nocardia brasiliensis]